MFKEVMQMKKLHITLLMILTITVLLTSCGGNNVTPTSKNPFRGGTDSVSVSFESEAPPAEIYAGTDYPFSIMLHVKNDGEYDIPKQDFSVAIQGIEAGLYGKSASYLIAEAANDDLLATKLDSEGNIIPGTEDYLEFSDLAYQNDLSARISVPIQADVCYVYGTKAQSSICLKRDPTKDNDNDVCAANEDKTIYTSSSPVQITDFKETPFGKSTVSFTFTIKHNSVGEIYARHTTCGDRGVNFADSDKVWVQVDVGVAGVSCTGLSSGTSTTEGFVKLGPEGRPITCKLDVDQLSNDFVQSVNILLEYDYRQILSTSLDVKPNIQ